MDSFLRAASHSLRAAVPEGWSLRAGDHEALRGKGSRNGRQNGCRALFSQRVSRSSNLSLERFRTSSKYQDRPAAADIAFCVAAYANGMDEIRMQCALEDDYLSRDPSLSKRAAYIRRTMTKARDWANR